MGLVSRIEGFKQNRREKKLLDEINVNVPRRVDWKKGAKDYMARLMTSQGEHSRLFELVKPFQGGPDYASFFEDMYSFINLIEKISLPPHSSVLDVGCGAGWVTHFLAKLGHHVTGIDISDELLAIARERIAADPFPPYVDKPFETDFLLLDIESEKLSTDDRFDCVLFMSALHHLYNPIQAIRNACQNLKTDGLLVILESSAPEPDSEYEKNNLDVMRKYSTLERPYTRSHLLEILNLCGFPHRLFYQPVNGLFRPDQVSLEKARESIVKQNWNIVVASRNIASLPDEIDRNRIVRNTGTVEFLAGFFDTEHEEGWGDYRWAGPEAILETTGISSVTIELQSVFMDPELDGMKVFISRDGTIIHHLQLTRNNPSIILELDAPNNYHRFVFMADYVFRPEWFGIPDKRMLSFKLKPNPEEFLANPA